MYTIIVDLLLVSLVMMLGAVLFLGSVVWVLGETASQAVAKATLKLAHAVAHFQLPAFRYQLQPHRATGRTRLHV